MKAWWRPVTITAIVFLKYFTCFCLSNSLPADWCSKAAWLKVDGMWTMLLLLYIKVSLTMPVKSLLISSFPQNRISRLSLRFLASTSNILFPHCKTIPVWWYTAESFDPRINTDCNHSHRRWSQMLVGVSGFWSCIKGVLLSLVQPDKEASMATLSLQGIHIKSEHKRYWSGQSVQSTLTQSVCQHSMRPNCLDSRNLLEKNSFNVSSMESNEP